MIAQARTRDIARRVAAPFILLAMGSIVAAGPAASQQPSTAQRNAIREACRSDYEAHCASVPTGGKPALMCLQKNMTSLSPDCQKAVGAIDKSSSAPAAAPTAAAPTAAAPTTQPTQQTGAAAAGAAPAAAGTAPAAPAGAATTTGVGAAPMAPPMRALTPRQEIALVRSSCGADFRAYCGDVRLGGGRAVECLRAKAASLSPTCQSALIGLRQSR
jgi:Cysteine rich repeat